MTHRSKKILSYIITIAAVAAGATWLVMKFYHPADMEFTDNARVEQQIVPVHTRVQGYIREIRFDEFSEIHKGDTLVIIDDSDARLNVARARADYQNALAGRGVADRSVGVASASAGVSDASIKEAKVVLDNAAADYARYQALLDKDAVTRRQYDAIKTDYEAKKARYEMLLRQQNQANSVVAESKGRIAQSDAGIDLAKTMLDVAELNLSYCYIIAPCDGYAARKDLQTGQLVMPGQTLLDIIDSSDIWVTANFKETQLRHIFPGSEVEIEVDAIPDVKFHGTVTAISQATGAELSLLPQDNSAGNFVKIRQRIPVRIRFASDNPADAMKRLRAGMNVECLVKY